MAESLLECMRSSGDPTAEAAEPSRLSWFYVLMMSSELVWRLSLSPKQVGELLGLAKIKPRHEERLPDTLVDDSDSDSCVISDDTSGLASTPLPVPTPSPMKHDNQLGEIGEVEPSPSPVTWHLLFLKSNILNAIGLALCLWLNLTCLFSSVITKVPPFQQFPAFEEIEEIEEPSMAAPRMN